jgi:hypothetical protein
MLSRPITAGLLLACAVFLPCRSSEEFCAATDSPLHKNRTKSEEGEPCPCISWPNLQVFSALRIEDLPVEVVDAAKVWPSIPSAPPWAE